MSDLTEGRVRAWLDGELEGPDAQAVSASMERDSGARATAESLRAREAQATALLELLDGPPAPTARVRDVVAEARARRAAETHGRRPSDLPARLSWARRSRLAQAAALVLLLAGAASATLIPGSPVRGWLERAFEPDPAPTASPAEVPGAVGVDEVGLAVAPEDGRVRVELLGLAAGAEIVVRLTNGSQVAVYAPQGSRFEREAGRIQARAEVGPVRVEIPEGLASADLLVDGRVYLTKRGDRLDLEVTPADSSATEIRLRAGS
ncbi:MAG TPA: hypothetical protein VLL48_05860 [Longimicrobiales bacterium]|nr:hypothetical protein [Longimicrobiales bacterium]